MVVWVGSVLEQELDELCVLASLLPGEFLIWSTATISRVCVAFIWGLLLPWPWHIGLACFVTKPLHGLAVPCIAHMSWCSHMLKLEPSGAAQFWSACSYLVLSRLWTSTSVQWQCTLSKLNSVYSVQTEFLTLTFWLALVILFCRFEVEYDQKIFFRTVSLGFSLGQTCNFPFSFLFIIS